VVEGSEVGEWRWELDWSVPGGGLNGSWRGRGVSGLGQVLGNRQAGDGVVPWARKVGAIVGS